MKAGRELDALVAEKVMGHEVEWGTTWTWLDWGSDYPTEDHGPGIPNRDFEPGHVNPPLQTVPEYSTEIAAAWKVVEKMHGQNESVRSDFLDDIGSWWFGADEDQPAVIALPAEKAATRICIAALKALEV